MVYKDKNGTPGRTLTYTYTGDGQVWSISDSSTDITTHYTYDTLGRLIRSTAGSMETSNQYDSFNRLVSRSFWDTVLSGGTETYTYDTDTSNYISEGLITGMQMANGHTIAYQYDSLQRLKYRHINSGKTGGGMWEGYTYKAGSAANTTTPQIQAQKNWLNDTIVTNNFLYEYDGNGNITEETRQTYTIPTSSQETQPEDAYTTASIEYTYDELDQLIREDNQKAGKTWTWEYDSAGNILNRKEYAYTTAEDLAEANLLDTVIYYYIAEENTAGAALNDWKDSLKSVGRMTGENGTEIKYNIEYDAIGNPTNYYDGTAGQGDGSLVP